MDTAHRTQSGCRELAESPADVCSGQAGTYARHFDWRRCGRRLGSALRLIDTSPNRRNHTDKARSRGKALNLFKPIFAAIATASVRPLTASMGADNSAIPGSILPCANCHGHEGRGKAESGTVPSDLTWDALTKPYG